MKQRWTIAILTLTLVNVVPVRAQAGWVVEWTNTTTNAAGTPIRTEPATMFIAANRMRVEQPTTISITDYKKKQISLLDPVRKVFWSGSLDQYVLAVTRNRDEALKSRIGTEKDLKNDEIDQASLPFIEIEKFDEVKTIAGQPTQRHQIRVNGEAFQDLWVAAGINTNEDLDPDLFLSYQRKMSATMLGKSAADYDALYRSKEYRDLLGSGFALTNLTRHIAGSFERTATSVQPTEIGPEQFEVPESYRRVRLVDVFASDD